MIDVGKKLKFRLRGPDLQEFIIKMVSALGQQLNTTEDMLQEATCFYQQLFSLMETHRIQYDFITLFEPTLNLVEQNKLETPLLRTKFISNFNKLKNILLLG